MKILVKSPNERTIRLRIPNFLVTTNCFVAMICQKIQDNPLSKDQIKQISKALRESYRYFKKLEMINVEDHDGTVVRIRL
ncbi:MAG: hypothetical protein PHP41_04230 [Bacilli bacterium]|nr:hypothetical protein [Bacilli bacterium]